MSAQVVWKVFLQAQTIIGKLILIMFLQTWHSTGWVAFVLTTSPAAAGEGAGVANWVLHLGQARMAIAHVLWYWPHLHAILGWPRLSSSLQWRQKTTGMAGRADWPPGGGAGWPGWPGGGDAGVGAGPGAGVVAGLGGAGMGGGAGGGGVDGVADVEAAMAVLTFVGLGTISRSGSDPGC